MVNKNTPFITTVLGIFAVLVTISWVSSHYPNNISLKNNTNIIASTELEETIFSPDNSSEKVTVAAEVFKNAIEGVYMSTESNYGMNGVYVVNNIYILYKDGTLCKNLSDDPVDVDIEASKKKDPRKWGAWKKAEKVILITWSNGKQSTIKNYHLIPTVDYSKSLSGDFKSSDPFGGSQVINYNHLSLKGNQFSWGKFKAGSSSWKPLYTESKTAGSYKVYDYSIELRFNDGVVEKYFFCFYPEKNNYFVIGSSHFLPINK